MVSDLLSCLVSGCTDSCTLVSEPLNALSKSSPAVLRAFFSLILETVFCPNLMPDFNPAGTDTAAVVVPDANAPITADLPAF